MPGDKEDDQVTRQVREIHPRGNQASSSETRIAPRAKPAPVQGRSGQDAPTIINPGGEEGSITKVRRSGAPPSPAPDQPQGKANAADTYEPVTGWLVAVKGPGKGSARAIFEGMNSVGRDTGQRIALDFNDAEISREQHFYVSYDPKKRAFHIINGVKTNLVYLNGDAVYSPMPLAEGDEIEVGATKLRFVPLCGPKFSWDEA
jgi:hypothetical protein